MKFALSDRQFSCIGADGRRLVEPGAFEVSVGGQQPGFHGPLDAPTTGVVTGTVRLAGKRRELDQKAQWR